MTETSFYWDGLVTGDASLSPYTTAIWNASIQKKLLTKSDNQGVLRSFLDELLVAGVAISVGVSAGAALVEGYFYESSSLLNVAIPTPITDPRIDRIILRKDPSTQTVRIARLAGTENASPTAPALTQAPGNVFEISLGQALITTGGVITITDEREFASFPLSPVVDLTALSTITPVGVASVDFSDISQSFRHLVLRGTIKGNQIGSNISAEIRLNGDSTATNYWNQAVANLIGTGARGIASNNFPGIAANVIGGTSNDGFPVDIIIHNYALTTFYKTLFDSELRLAASSGFNLSYGSAIWLNTDAVNRIQLVLTGGGTFVAGSTITLYGRN